MNWDAFISVSIKTNSSISLLFTSCYLFYVFNNIFKFSFQQSAKELSERFRDRPMPPLETAIYWVEYVARHKGAHFMKTAAVNMPFYQYYLLDVIAFILAILSVVFYLNFLILRMIWRKIGAFLKPKQKSKVKET